MKHESVGQALQAAATVRRFRILLALALALPVVMFLAFGWYEYRRVASGALDALDSTARIVHEHAIKTLESNEVVLDRLIDLLGEVHTQTVGEDEYRFHSVLTHVAGRLDQIRNVMVWSEEGQPLASSRYYPVRRDVNVADRSFFIRHKHDGITFSINEPMEGRLSGERIFHVSKVRRYADGRFGGVVSVSLSPQYFRDFYRRVIRNDLALAITLIRPDGEIVSRYPAPDRVVRLAAFTRLVASEGQSAEDGVLTGMRGVDGQLRYVAYQRVAPYALYIAVSRTESSVFSEWRHDVLVSASFFFPPAMILVFALWIARKRAEREHEAIVLCHAEEVRRRVAEEQLFQLQKFEALGQLTSGVAHDFNNLLHVVSTNASVMNLLPHDTDKSRHFTAITHAVSTGQALVAHLLAFARKQPLRLDHASPAAIVPDMCDLARHSLPRTIELQCIVDAGVWDIKVDRAELELAIINMAVNSRDAMPKGGKITVRVRNVPSDSAETIDAKLPSGEFVALSISDTGSGIPPTLLDRVFEPFFTTKAATKGTGLGLSRVYAYAVHSGGIARAANGKDIGAVITIYIPRAGESQLIETIGGSLGLQRALNTACAD